MTTNRTTTRRIAGLAAMTLVLAAGTVLAGPETSEKPLKGSFDQPLTTKARSSGGGVTMIMSEADGDDTYTIKVQGDDVSAEVNGKSIPAERVRRQDGRVQILDEAGDVVKEFHIGAFKGLGEGGVRGMQGLPLLQFAPGGAVQIAQPEPPKVMMGITMSGGDDGEGIHIDSIVDGLPADNAGLKTGDVIVAIDDKSIESQKTLRDILREKNPGDKLELLVKRDGEEKVITLKLAKFDKEKLPGAMTPMQDMQWRGQDHDKAWEEARQAIEQALKEIKEAAGGDAKQFKGEAEKALKQALKAMESAKGSMTMTMEDWQRSAPQAWRRFYTPEPGQSFVTPQTPGQPAAPEVGGQLDKLSRQLDRLNKRLDEMERKLDRREQDRP